MSDFVDFLTMPNVDDLISDEYISEYIGTVRIKAMNADEHGAYQQKALGNLDAKSARKGQFKFDNKAYNLACVANQMIKPNFKDAEFLKQLGVNLPEEGVKLKIPSGAIDEIATRIKRLSGFDNDINEDIEEAKN